MNRIEECENLNKEEMSEEKEYKEFFLNTTSDSDNNFQENLNIVLDSDSKVCRKDKVKRNSIIIFFSLVRKKTIRLDWISSRVLCD